MQNGSSDRVNVDIDLPDDKKIVVKWDRKVGLESKVRMGNLLGTYTEVGNPEAKPVKIKAPIHGKVIFMEPADQEISPKRICIMEKCKHDVIMADMCTFCSQKIEKHFNESVGFAHKSFLLSHDKARELYEEMEIKVLDDRKLFLILDLDNTLIHAELIWRQNNASERLELGFDPLKEKDVSILEFYRDKFVVKLRPFLQEFLANLSLKYQIHVYTKGTRDYAERILKQVDPHGIYVSNDRLISRNEMGENEFKSIRKVIHDGSMALILDDRSDVWGSIKNLVYTQPYNIYEISQGKLNITTKADVFLYMIRDVLEFVHEIFYHMYDLGEKVKIYEVYQTLRTNLFAKERVAFHGIFETEEDLKKSREYKSIQRLGAADIQLAPTKDTTLIFSRVSSKITGYPITEAPVVSLWYLYYCETYCIHLNPDDFDLRKPNESLMKLEKSTSKKRKENKEAKYEMEDYLQKAGSNKGGLSCLKETIIRKLQERVEKKKNGRNIEELLGEGEVEGEDGIEEITKKLKGEGGEVPLLLRKHSEIIEREEDHHILDLNTEGHDNQEIIDKEVSMVQHIVE